MVLCPGVINELITDIHCIRHLSVNVRSKGKKSDLSKMEVCKNISKYSH